MIRKYWVLIFVILMVINLNFATITNVSKPDTETINSSPSEELLPSNIEALSRTSNSNLMMGSRSNEPVTFVNVSEEANIAQFSGNYFAWADYNNDGYQDLLVNGRRLLRNNGPPGWNFTDVTTIVNISYTGSINVGVWGDWDNDRSLDFYAAGGGWTTNNPTTYDVLWRNTGYPNYTFEDVTISAGNVRDQYPSVAAGWGDYDNDGHLDLYVANYENTDLVGYPDTLWHNNGDGTFTEVSSTSGINSEENRPGRGVAWCDYNNDGWNDIYISNYRIKGNFLWENQHDGTFKNVAPEKNCQGLVHYYQSYGPYYGHTIGSAWGDFNNDGLFDVWVSNLVHKYVGAGDIRGYICDDSNIYSNLGGPKFNFSDIRPSTGIPYKPVGGQGTYIGDELWSGVAIGDYDNDGDQDVFVPQIYDLNYANSFLFQNNNDGTFTDVAQSLGLRCYNTYGSAWCDYNNDGFLDLVTGGKSPFIAQDTGSYEIHLFKNEGNKNNWLKVKLGGLESNNAGIGARIKVTTSLGTQYRQMEGGMGSHSQQNSLVTHFGLGSASTINALEVIWPNGRGNIFHNFPANQEIEVVEELWGPEITSISVSKTEINEDDSVEFDGSATDLDGTITKYEWDFDGDGIFDWSSTSKAKTTKQYQKSGKYYAKLRVWDDSGRYFTDKSTPFIVVNNVVPTAIAGNDITAYEDENITFDASLSIDTESDLGSLEFNWSFGNGEYSGWVNNTDLQYSYADNGIYEVSLFVKDDDNEIGSDSIFVTIKNRIPECKISVDNEVINEDTEVSFKAQIYDTPSDISSILLRWDFGDGNYTNWDVIKNIKHVYTKSGTFFVRCTVRDDDWPRDENFTKLQVTVYNIEPTCIVEVDESVDEDEKVYFYASGNDTPSDLRSLQYLWDFADGSNSGWLEPNAQNITHIYTKSGFYQAKLILRDNDNARCIKFCNITVNNLPPICSAMAQSEFYMSEDDIQSFYGSGADTKSDEPKLKYSWNFGVIGLPSTPWNISAEFQYKYSNEGIYHAVLTVRDDDGATGNASVQVSVQNVEPTPKFRLSASSINEDEVVEFDASDTTDTPSDIESLNYTWTFDVGVGEKFGKYQQYIYSDSGKYRVRLKVTDDNGDFKTISETITIRNVKPKADITVSTRETYIGSSIVFSAHGSWDTSSDIDDLEYTWNFGDNKKGTGQMISHSYTKEGSYKVILSVTDDDSETDEVELEIKIRAPKPVSEEEEEGSSVVFFVLAMLSNIILIIFLILFLIYYIKGYIPIIYDRRDQKKTDEVTQTEVRSEQALQDIQVGEELNKK